MKQQYVVVLKQLYKRELNAESLWIIGLPADLSVFVICISLSSYSFADIFPPWGQYLSFRHASSILTPPGEILSIKKHGRSISNRYLDVRRALAPISDPDSALDLIWIQETAW